MNPRLSRKRTLPPNVKRDIFYMRMALALAERGQGRTNPNPMVGAVLVNDGKVISTGYHKKAGMPHAEIEAIRAAGERSGGATLYVTLEPCSHFGKTPPCVNRIISRGIRRVVVGMVDPNPINNGKGISILKENGVKVTTGVLKDETERLNRVFSRYILSKRPYVTLKAAQSLDGKIATFTGHSKWITNEDSREYVHTLRSQADAIVVGTNTILKDDPLLTARSGPGVKQPIRIILDSRLSTPADSRVLKDRSSPVIIATTIKAFSKKARRLRDLGAEVMCFKPFKGMVDLKALLGRLAERGISHLFVEGGGSVNAGFLERALADEVVIFISPRIIGGRGAVTSFEGRGARRIEESVVIENMSIKNFGKDIMVRGDVYRDS